MFDFDYDSALFAEIDRHNESREELDEDDPEDFSGATEGDR